MRRTKKKRIAGLVKALNNLHRDEHAVANARKELYAGCFYPFANDQGFSAVFEKLRQMPLPTEDNRTIRVGVLVGESFLCSLLSELKNRCDLIVIADSNPLLLMHMRNLIDHVLQSTDINDFKRRYVASRVTEPHPPASHQTPDLALQQQVLGVDHFLSSATRFRACQNAARRLQFAFCYTNFFDLRNQAAFLREMENRKVAITVVNLTNLYEWDARYCLATVRAPLQWQSNGNIAVFVNALCQRNLPLMMGSFRTNAVDSCALELCLFESGEAYLKGCQERVSDYLLHKFTVAPALILHQAQQFTLFMKKSWQYGFQAQDPLQFQHRPLYSEVVGASLAFNNR